MTGHRPWKRPSKACTYPCNERLARSSSSYSQPLWLETSISFDPHRVSRQFQVAWGFAWSYFWFSEAHKALFSRSMRVQVEYLASYCKQSSCSKGTRYFLRQHWFQLGNCARFDPHLQLDQQSNRLSRGLSWLRSGGVSRASCDRDSRFYCRWWGARDNFCQSALLSTFLWNFVETTWIRNWQEVSACRLKGWHQLHAYFQANSIGRHRLGNCFHPIDCLWLWLKGCFNCHCHSVESCLSCLDPFRLTTFALIWSLTLLFAPQGPGTWHSS